MNCRRKVAYRTEYQAHQCLEILREHGAADSFKLRVYRCRHCGAFHLGHPVTAERKEFLRYLSLQFGH